MFRSLIAPAFIATIALAGTSVAGTFDKDWRGYDKPMQKVQIEKRHTDIDVDIRKKSLDLDVNDSFNKTKTVNKKRLDVDINDSFNKTTTINKKHLDLDIRKKDLDFTAKMKNKTQQRNDINDTQDASNKAHLSGHNQNATQGDFVIGGPLYAPMGSSKTKIKDVYVKQRSSNQIDGANFGAVSNFTTSNVGGEQTFGDSYKGSIVGSQLGNQQGLTQVGDQTQAQSNEQKKKSQNDAANSNATDQMQNQRGR